MKYTLISVFSILILSATIMETTNAQNQQRARDLGIHTGILSTGNWNAITDVDGVKVGHQTLIEGQNIRTGVTRRSSA